MTHQVHQLLAAMGESKRVIEQMIPGLAADSANNTMESLLQCSMSELLLLLNNLSHLSRITHAVADAVMLAQKKLCALQEVSLTTSAAEAVKCAKTYLLNQSELEQMCLELVRCYEERFGLGELGTLKWYSDSGDTLIERRGLMDSQEFIGLVQDMDASEAQYTLRHRNTLVFAFHSRLWPEFQTRADHQKKVVIPRACYFELLAYHKVLDSQWYRSHYSINSVASNQENADSYANYSAAFSKGNQPR